MFASLLVEIEFFSRITKNTDGKGVEEFVGDNESFVFGGFQCFLEGFVPTPFITKGLLLPVLEVRRNLDEMVVKMSSRFLRTSRTGNKGPFVIKGVGTKPSRKH